MLTRLKLINVLTVCLTLLTSGMTSAIASEAESRGFPTGEREGGGARGEARSDCYSEQQTPIPLVPRNSAGLTSAASPTLLFYVPQSEQPQALKFVLFNDNDEIVYQETFNADKARIVNLSLPGATTAKTLAVGQPYRWYLVKNCNSGYLPKVVDGGTIRRVQLDQTLESQLSQADPLERVKLYQEANIWYEALRDLAELRCARPHSSVVAAKWTELLNSAGLDEVSQESIVPYCSEQVGLR